MGAGNIITNAPVDLTIGGTDSKTNDWMNYQGNSIL
jgi:hypothetical protein